MRVERVFIIFLKLMTGWRWQWVWAKKKQVVETTCGNMRKIALTYLKRTAWAVICAAN